MRIEGFIDSKARVIFEDSEVLTISSAALERINLAFAAGDFDSITDEDRQREAWSVLDQGEDPAKFSHIKVEAEVEIDVENDSLFQNLIEYSEKTPEMVIETANNLDKSLNRSALIRMETGMHAQHIAEWLLTYVPLERAAWEDAENRRLEQLLVEPSQ